MPDPKDREVLTSLAQLERILLVAPVVLELTYVRAVRSIKPSSTMAFDVVLSCNHVRVNQTVEWVARLPSDCDCDCNVSIRVLSPVDAFLIGNDGLPVRRVSQLAPDCSVTVCVRRGATNSELVVPA